MTRMKYTPDFAGGVLDRRPDRNASSLCFDTTWTSSSEAAATHATRTASDRNANTATRDGFRWWSGRQACDGRTPRSKECGATNCASYLRRAFIALIFLAASCWPQSNSSAVNSRVLMPAS